jgi:hypothetical protein
LDNKRYFPFVGMFHAQIRRLSARVDAAQLATSAVKKPTVAPRGGGVPRRSDAKLSKLHTIRSALERDRNAFESMKPFSLKESVKEFPWKFFFSFMGLWTLAGYSIIPAFKGLNADGTVTASSEEAAQRRQLSFLAKQRRRLLERKRDIADERVRLEMEENDRLRKKD